MESGKINKHVCAGLNVGMFMTLGIGVRNWEKNGSLSRELSLYNSLSLKGVQTTIFTYDINLPDLKLNCKHVNLVTRIPKHLPRKLYWLYALLMPFIFYEKGKKLDILKTNQTSSGWPAVLCSIIWNKKLIARCGYVLGESAETKKLKGLSVKIGKFLEKITFKYADTCFIPTIHLKKWVVENYNIDHRKIHVMPNNVDEDLFKPTKNINNTNIPNIIVVGRLVEVKRIDMVIEAVRDEKWKLTVVGDGPLKADLVKIANDKNVLVEFLGNCNNVDLPNYLNDSDIYVICSTWEGHPKALIEAMACGCACIGTNSPGIKEVISHLETGLVCSENSEALHDAIEMLIEDKKLRDRLSQNARDFAVKNYSLNSRSQDEYDKMIDAIKN